METVKKLLKEKGVNPSIQRIKILKSLINNTCHPTAKDIYKKISKEIPTLSKTTVYNTVKLFAEKGILQTLITKEGETRYDIKAIPHPHFRCKKCENIFDIDKELVVENKQEIDGHLIEEKCVCYWGICRNCRKR
jgi:Fur family transcriptional regulator, peroxide stress response regulator